MPKVEIGTAYGVTVRIEANEASVEDLRKQAMESFREACEVEQARPTGPAGSAWIDRRGTPTHTDPNYRSNFGFAPIKAEGGDQR